MTQSLRGKPAIMYRGTRYLMMSDNSKRTLWRCSYMATKSLKCPARITEYKGAPTSRFVYNKGRHEHAELKRGKYVVKTDTMPMVHNMYGYTIEESVDYESWP